jgi:signal transduction histidine kinase/DNA-binding response OmpR family regulator
MEDDPGVARLFQRRLEKQGYQVDLAENGEIGLEKYRAGKYHVICIDQRMPVLDGLQVIRLLAEDPHFPPTIMITGAGDEQIAVQALKLGASDYIVKDTEGVYLELLPSVIEQVLRHEELVREREQARAALEQRNRNLILLNDIGQVLTATLDFDQIVAQTLRFVTTLTGAECASLWLWKPAQSVRTNVDTAAVDPQKLECHAVLCGNEYSGCDVLIGPGEGSIGVVAQSGRSSILGSDAEGFGAYPEISAYGVTVRTLMTFSLRSRARLIGVLQVVNRLDGQFDADSLLLAETLAAHAAVAIENARLVKEMREQTSELQKRNEELDAFSHTVAHDLKNPVTSVLGHIQYLKRRATNVLGESEKKNVEYVEQSALRMRQIIDDLLLLAGIRSAEIRIEPLDMDRIVRQSLQRVHHMPTFADATIALPDTWPTSLGQASWIEEVWVNYLANALKYGGSQPVIELGGVEHDEKQNFYWIRDHGKGIAPEHLPLLFKPFSRLSDMETEGHGVGLSIVRRIIEKLGGQVTVESIVDQGTTFGFTLPRS